MAAPSDRDKIREVALQALQEYVAYDKTLAALAALRTVLESAEVRAELKRSDFRPRLISKTTGGQLTPDGLILLSENRDFVLELKTSWNETDVDQVCKYAESPAWLDSDGAQIPFGTQKCVLLGYQKPVGQSNLDKLFSEFKAQTKAALVVFRYALESAGLEQTMSFNRLGHQENGICPSSEFGKLFNFTVFSVPARVFKFSRSAFDKANDGVVDCYGAVLWWNKYAIHYLNDSQRAEMAAEGRLSSPLTIVPGQIGNVPEIEGTEVGLNGDDVRRALEFLRQARLVQKTRKGGYEIPLKTSIRLPLDAPEVTQNFGEDEVTYKVVMRWATYKVLKPVKEKKPNPKKSKTKRGRDNRTLPLFPGVSDKR